MESEERCRKCNNTGIVKEDNGVSHTCFDCLLSGKMDQHTNNIRDSKSFGVRI